MRKSLIVIVSIVIIIIISGCGFIESYPDISGKWTFYRMTDKKAILEYYINQSDYRLSGYHNSVSINGNIDKVGNCYIHSYETISGFQSAFIIKGKYSQDKITGSLNIDIPSEATTVTWEIYGIKTGK